MLTRGGGGRGSLWGCLRTRQATHPPKLTHTPTHPDPPLPPHRWGGGGLCCYNQLVTQKTLCICQKKFCPSVIMRSLNSGIAELAVTLVVDHCTGKLLKRWFNPRCLWTGHYCHFSPHTLEIFATF